MSDRRNAQRVATTNDENLFSLHFPGRASFSLFSPRRTAKKKTKKKKLIRFLFVFPQRFAEYRQLGQQKLRDGRHARRQVDVLPERDHVHGWK